MIGRELGVFVSFLVIAAAVTFGYLLARKLAPMIGVS